MFAVCSPWWPMAKGSSQSRTGHSGEGRRGALTDEFRLIHWSLLKEGVKKKNSLVLKMLQKTCSVGEKCLCLDFKKSDEDTEDDILVACMNNCFKEWRYKSTPRFTTKIENKLQLQFATKPRCGFFFFLKKIIIEGVK